MISTGALVIYSLGDRQYGIPVSDVDQVFPAAQPTPLPDSPQGLLGLVDIQGEVLPVIDLHVRCGQGSRETLPSDFFLLVSSFGRKLLLRVDSVEEVTDSADLEIVESSRIIPGLDGLTGIFERPEGLVILPDYRSLLKEELRSCT